MNTHRRSTGLTKVDAVIGFLIGAGAFGLYLRTLAPGLLFSDSAEFQVLAHFQATAHTTGYSIYLLLAKLFALLPVGEIAYRVNLFSAFMAGLTVAEIYLTAVLSTRSRPGAVIAAVAFAISATFWSQAVIAEVYSSASAFLAVVLALTLAWYRSRQARFLFWAGLVGASSLGVHGSVMLAAPGVLALLAASRPNLRRDLPAAAGGILLGLGLMFAAFSFQDANRSPYNIFETAYLPAASAWGQSAESLDSTLERFRFIIAADQWRPAMFADPASVMPGNASSYGESLLRDYAWPVLGLVLLGWGAFFSVDRRLGMLLLVGYLCHMIYTFNYSIGDVYVFFVPAGVYTALAAAAGVRAVERAVGWASDRLPRGRAVWLGPAAQVAATLALLIAAVWPFAAGRMEFLRAGEARFDFAGIPSAVDAKAWRKNITDTVRQLEPNAIVYLGWGDLYAYYYVAYIDLGRTDLHFIEPTPYSQKGGMAESMLAHIRANRLARPQYFQFEIDRMAQVGLYTRMRSVGPSRFFILQSE